MEADHLGAGDQRRALATLSDDGPAKPSRTRAREGPGRRADLPLVGAALGRPAGRLRRHYVDEAGSASVLPRAIHDALPTRVEHERVVEAAPGGSTVTTASATSPASRSPTSSSVGSTHSSFATATAGSASASPHAEAPSCDPSCGDRRQQHQFGQPAIASLKISRRTTPPASESAGAELPSCASGRPATPSRRGPRRSRGG